MRLLGHAYRHSWTLTTPAKVAEDDLLVSTRHGDLAITTAHNSSDQSKEIANLPNKEIGLLECGEMTTPFKLRSSSADRDTRGSPNRETGDRVPWGRWTLRLAPQPWSKRLEGLLSQYSLAEEVAEAVSQ